MLIPPLVDTAPFTIIYQDRPYRVNVEKIGDDLVYLIQPNGGSVYIALTRAKGMNTPKFWATLPENKKRHKEAQEFGELIFEHYRNSK
jgi:hypothetical protein